MDLRNRVGIFRELWLFMLYKRKFWIGSIMAILILIGLLIVFAQGSALAPFIYALF